MKKQRKVGAKITFLPSGRDKPVSGTVTYIHPKNRFVQVEYQTQTPFGMSPPLRECLQIAQGIVFTGANGNPK